ncbi:SAM-dependent methyltransferase [Pandoraea sp. SD6-2]|uniref:SAM-dependent methyltransferase n=1 Tax=Pandoraea sp. SD6-2 TaxID=1286093 RepID=UPI00056B84A6|nr:SAM-dependent methyltransferase [Pandoraea sp. SD6-2]
MTPTTDKARRLKIGELAKKVGLSVRALHHYDAIGLLSPSQRLGRRLQYIVDMIAAGGEATATDWLNTLELVNMYQKHLDDDELDALLASGPDTVPPTDPAWGELIDEVRCAVQQALPAESDAAQALAWRWIRCVIRMTRNDPALATKLTMMQLGEPRAQQIVGITAEMLAWIDEAFTHARCALLAKYLSPAQADEVRRRQFATLKSRAWPALVAELKAHRDAGVDAGATPMQAIVERWQQLFRESFCGDDAVLKARVRDALMREPDLQLGIGLDDSLLAYLHKAYIVGHDMTPANAGPKPSALMVATQRAAHQLLDRPLVLEDPVALTILGAAEAQALREDIDRFRHPTSVGMRSTVVVRSRLADDVWAEAVERGIRQYVVLGAGLDTSAYRHPDAPGRLFEVDLPATQQWKQARLRDTGIAVPPSLHFVPVDFESVGLAEGLARAGFDADAPAIFSWLGVTMYLDEAAVIETLRFIAGCAKGSVVLFEYVMPLSSLPPGMRIAMEQLTAQFAARGEPWKSFFDPAALAETLITLGFSRSDTWAPDELNQRYLENRVDGLHIGATPARLVLATV